MGKITSFFEEQKNSIKDIYRVYLITLISTIILAVIVAMVHMDYETMQHIVVILGFTAIGCFYVETISESKRKKGLQEKSSRYIKCAIMLFVAVVIDILGNVISDIENDVPMWYFTWCVALFSMFCVGSALYIIIKDSGLKFNQYLPRALFGLLEAWGVLLVLFVATLLILGIFNSLIAVIDYWDGLYKAEVILAAAVYLPLTLSVFNHTDEDNAKFTKGFVLYALIPCLWIAMAIVYLYILKIIFTVTMPSNEVFYICASMFAVGLPIWTMAQGFLPEEEVVYQDGKPDLIGLYRKIVTNMRYIYAPLILLEAISMGIRIFYYGWTEARYVGMCFVVFQIIYTIWNREKYEQLIYVAIGMVAFATLMPGLSAPGLSYMSQRHRFEKAYATLQSGNYSDGEAAIQAGESYNFLKWNLYGEKYLKTHYTEQERDAMGQLIFDVKEEYNVYVNEYEKWEYVTYGNYNYDEKGISVKGYSKIYRVNYYGNNDTCDYKSVNLKFNGDIWHNVDLTDCINYIKNLQDSHTADIDTEPYVLRLDSEHDLIITSFRANIEYYTTNIRGISIDGYILER